MADRATQIINFYETTLASLLPAGNTSATLTDTPGINATLSNEDTWFYLVVDPDSSGSREIIVVKASSGTSLTTIERDLETDHSGTGPDHQSGTTVRMAVLAQHIDDQNDRVATNITSLDTAISDFNTNGNAAIANINSASADAMMENATDGSSMTVDNANDYILVYDNDTTTAKQVNLNQLNLGTSLGLVIALS